MSASVPVPAARAQLTVAAPSEPPTRLTVIVAVPPFSFTV